jgi:hypothetical protein
MALPILRAMAQTQLPCSADHPIVLLERICKAVAMLRSQKPDPPKIGDSATAQFVASIRSMVDFERKIARSESKTQRAMVRLLDKIDAMIG